jgi:outer membrane protein insertion porin family
MMRAILFSALIGMGCATSGFAATDWIVKSQSSIEIDRIDIQGVKVFTEQMIESALDIAPGDRLERQKVVRTEENFQNLYRTHGYEEAKVQSKLVRKKVSHQRFETVLEFEVIEGKPTRVAEVKVVPFGVTEESEKKDWKSRERKLQASVTFRPGDVLDQEKIADTRRAIQELLASEQYIGARIEKVSVSQAKAPEGASGMGPNLETGRWVSLEIRVSLGDRVSFGFRGNTVFSRGHLSSVVEEQRLLGLGKDYIGVLRAKLEDEYRSAGYSQVAISTYTIELPNRSERKVVYVIQEGPRVRIDSIDFDGNAIFSSQKLRDKFYSRASGLVQKNIYVEKDVQKAAELLIEWVKERGYLAAKLVTITPYYPSKPRTQQAKSSVRLLVYLYEGDQTIVQDIAVQGLNEIKKDEFEKILGIEKGEPLNLYSFSEGVEQLKKYYRDKGYLGFRILNEGSENLIQYSQENHFADISIQLEEGPKYRVSRIEIEGLANTQESVVKREITLKTDDVLSEQELIQTERQIRRLGIFASVSIRLLDDENDAHAKIVRITLHEAERGILTWGPGFRNDLGVRGFGQLAYTNLLGLNHTASFTANINRRYYRYNFIEGQAQFAYAWPWWFGLPDLTFRPTVAVGQTQYINFSAQTISASAAWDKPLWTRPNINASFSYSFEKIRQFRANDSVDEQQLRIASISPKISIDLRDSPLVPTSGFFASTWFDLAHPLLGSQNEPYPIGYYRLQMRSDYHLPVWKGIVWYFSFRTGYENALNVTKDSPGFKSRSVDAIPLVKQFALGGIGSVRGYQELEINKQDSLIQGTLSYVNYRTQLDFPFSGALKFGLFLDAANLLVDEYSLGRLKYGTGFGFHYQTPVGAVNFDWGFKLDPPPNSSPYVIHFSVGVI